MRFTKSLLVALALAAGILAGCGDPQPVTSAPQTPTAQTATPAAQVPVAQATQLVAGWPPAAPENLPVAPNLLADNYLVVFDASGSMASSSCGTAGRARLETGKDGVITFAGTIPPNANLGLVVFGSGTGIKLWLPLGVGNRAEFLKQVKSIYASGGTPLWSSIKLAADLLTIQAQMQRGYGTYRLIVVTDGDADFGEDPGNYVKTLVRTTPITVHAIGFCVNGKHSLDIKGVTQYTSASDRQQLERGLAAVLAESESFADSKFSPQ